MFRNKQPEKIEYRTTLNPNQLLEILAKLDEIDRKLGAWADNVKRFDQKLATVIEHRNQSVKATTMGLQWARDVERKLDTLIEQRNQPMQPVDDPPVDDERGMKVVASDGKLKRKFYQNDPLGFVERKIYNATSMHKTATCISLSALLTNVNTPGTKRRPKVTPALLVGHLKELLKADIILAVKASRTRSKSKVLAGDIAFIMADKSDTLPNRYSVISTNDAEVVLNLFARWSNNG